MSTTTTDFFTPETFELIPSRAVRDAIALMRSKLEARGYRMSAASWADLSRGKVFLFSTETWGPATYHHAMFTIEASIGPNCITILTPNGYRTEVSTIPMS